MVDWNNLIPKDFEYDFNKDKLAAHKLTFDEAVETFFNDYLVRRNKKFKDRYLLEGVTFGGKKIKIVFQLKNNNVVRIITGWSI